MKWKDIKGDDKGRKRFSCEGCGNALFVLVKQPELVKKHRGKRSEQLAVYCPICNREPLSSLTENLRPVGYPRRRRSAGK